LGALHQENAALAALFAAGIPDPEPPAGRFRLRFDRSESFAVQMADTKERRAELERFLAARSGQPVALEIEVGDLRGQTSVARRRAEHEDLVRQRDEEARQHPLVRQTMSELGGTVTRVQLGELGKKRP